MKAHRPTIMGTRHMASATQYLAAEAGFRILEAGGNAIDAGVAAGMALAAQGARSLLLARNPPARSAVAQGMDYKITGGSISGDRAWK